MVLDWLLPPTTIDVGEGVRGRRWRRGRRRRRGRGRRWGRSRRRSWRWRRRRGRCRRWGRSRRRSWRWRRGRCRGRRGGRCWSCRATEVAGGQVEVDLASVRHLACLGGGPARRDVCLQRALRGDRLPLDNNALHCQQLCRTVWCRTDDLDGMGDVIGQIDRRADRIGRRCINLRWAADGNAVDLEREIWPVVVGEIGGCFNNDIV